MEEIFDLARTNGVIVTIEAEPFSRNIQVKLDSHRALHRRVISITPSKESQAREIIVDSINEFVKLIPIHHNTQRLARDRQIARVMRDTVDLEQEVIDLVRAGDFQALVSKAKKAHSSFNKVVKNAEKKSTKGSTKSKAAPKTN